MPSAVMILLYGFACFGAFVAFIVALAWVFCRDAPIGYARPIGYGYPIVATGWNHASDHGLEPHGGNLYRRHVHRAYTGQLWQCAHGWTCGNDGVVHWEPPVLKHPRWMICKWCALNDPIAYIRWRFNKEALS